MSAVSEQEALEFLVAMGHGKSPETAAAREKRVAESCAENRRRTAHVANVPYEATHEQIAKHFGVNTLAVTIPLDGSKKPPARRGFVFVTFSTVEALDHALKKFNGQSLLGRRLFMSKFDLSRVPPLPGGMWCAK